MRSPVVELFAELASALQAAGVRWYLFGAQAALLHGAARLTADVDVTVDLGERTLPALLGTLEGAGFSPRVAEIEAFAERNRVLPMVHESSGIAVDATLAGSGLEEVFFQRVEERIIDGVRVPVASAEDVLVMKLLAGRPKDVDDVVSILAAQADNLDLGLVRATLRQIEEALDRNDLVAELERALKQARR